MDYENDPGWKYLRMDLDTLLKEQSRPYDSKTDCWVPDAAEGYVAAQIKATKGDIVTVISKGGAEVNVKKDLIQEMNPPKFTKTEDMSNLSFLNDASVLANLRDRYASMLIYVRRTPFAWKLADVLGPVLCRHQPVQAPADLHGQCGEHLHWPPQERSAAALVVSRPVGR